MVVCPVLAVAAEPTCGGLRLAVETELDRRFPGLADSVRAAFSARDDMEGCPRVELAFSQQEIQLRVALADGRFAERSLARPEDVVPTLQALVIVPERTEPAEPTRARDELDSVSKPRQKPARRRAARPVRRAPTPDPSVADRGVLASGEDSQEPSALRIELSAAVGAHSGDNGRASLNFGLQSLLDIHRFLAGFQVRLDQYHDSGQDMGSAFEIAALTGRRFDFDVLALDVLLGPSLAFQASSNADVAVREGIAPPPMPPTPPEGDENATYAFLGVRSSFFHASTLRPFVAADASVRLDARDLSGVDVFPAWAVGVAVGATVGTL